MDAPVNAAASTPYLKREPLCVLSRRILVDHSFCQDFCQVRLWRRFEIFDRKGYVETRLHGNKKKAKKSTKHLAFELFIMRLNDCYIVANVRLLSEVATLAILLLIYYPK
jgi:hypothetical protein